MIINFLFKIKIDEFYFPKENKMNQFFILAYKAKIKIDEFINCLNNISFNGTIT
jgi:hypothetical protein